MKTQAKRKALRATDRSIARPDSASLNSSFLIRPSSFSRKGGGYILFELVLALGIFAIAVLGLAKSLNQALETANLLKRDQIIRIGMRNFFEEIRRKGYTTSINKVTVGGGVVTMLLPEMDGTQRMAVAIGGFAEVIAANVEPFVEVMRGAIARNLQS